MILHVQLSEKYFSKTHSFAIYNVISFITTLINTVLVIKGNKSEASTPGRYLIEHDNNLGHFAKLSKVLLQVVLGCTMLDASNKNFLRFGNELRGVCVNYWFTLAENLFMISKSY